MTDAHKDAQELFGKERMLETLNKNSGLSPAELLPAVKTIVDEYVEASPQFDDQTMLVLEYKG